MPESIRPAPNGAKRAKSRRVQQVQEFETRVREADLQRQAIKFRPCTARTEVAAPRHRNSLSCRGVAPSHEQHVQEMPMAKKEKTLEDLFHETLKDIYYAEKKILTALPKMAKAAQSEDLQAAFEKHQGETTDQVERLEQIFELMKHPAKGKTCDAINGMIDESQQVIKGFKGSAALDAGLLASAQAVEHYEISRYGTLKAWAEQLGLQKAVSILDETLEEKTDEALTELAKSAVTQEARQAAE